MAECGVHVWVVAGLTARQSVVSGVANGHGSGVEGRLFFFVVHTRISPAIVLAELVPFTHGGIVLAVALSC